MRPPGPQGLRANAKAALALVSEPCRPLTELSAAFGPTFEVALGPLRLVIVGDPEHARQVLSTDLDAFRWGRVTRSLAMVVGRGSMIVSDGAEHRRRRSLVQPAFARRRLDGWIPLVVAETDRIIDETIGARGAVGAESAAVAVDLYEVMRVLVRRIVVRVLFGQELGSRADEIGELLEPAMRYGVQPIARQIPHPFPFTRRAEARAARRAVDGLLDEVIAQRRADLARGEGTGSGAAPADLLGALLEAPAPSDTRPSDTGPGGSALTDSELRDQIVTLIAAGYDTTTAAVAWLLARAVSTPGVWDRLRTEADARLDPDAAAVDASVLSELTWSEAVGREALRLHPPGPYSPREVVRSLAVGPYELRRGTLLAWSPYLMGRDAGAWERPLEFRPERFEKPLTEPRENSPEQPFEKSAGGAPADPPPDPRLNAAWAPFGRGARSCIGFALAQMELTLIPSRLAQRLDIELTGTAMPSPRGIIVSRPDGGLPVRIRPRAHVT